MAFISVDCPQCGSDQVVKRGKTGNGKQRYLCQNPDCACKTFILDMEYKGRLPEVKEQIVEMALNGSGVRDTAPRSDSALSGKAQYTNNRTQTFNPTHSN